jgi:ketosteroid isomerase-like protein
MAVPSMTEDVVRRYYAVVADLGATEDDLRALLDPSATITEHPNPITPNGAVRSVDQTVQGFLVGKRLLSDQVFAVHEVVVDGERAAVRATWMGTVGQDAGPFTAGTALTARIGAFLTVREGRIVEHETFDCYEPF